MAAMLGKEISPHTQGLGARAPQPWVIWMPANSGWSTYDCSFFCLFGRRFQYECNSSKWECWRAETKKQCEKKMISRRKIGDCGSIRRKVLNVCNLQTFNTFSVRGRVRPSVRPPVRPSCVIFERRIWPFLRAKNHNQWCNEWRWSSRIWCTPRYLFSLYFGIRK